MRQEPAEVWLAAGRPVRFVWRGRQFTVLAILDRPPEPADPAAQRCWRVTASHARDVPVAVFQLCQDPLTGRWMMSRQND
jgi:hypothetical protein